MTNASTCQSIPEPTLITIVDRFHDATGLSLSAYGPTGQLLASTEPCEPPPSLPDQPYQKQIHSRGEVALILTSTGASKKKKLPPEAINAWLDLLAEQLGQILAYSCHADTAMREMTTLFQLSTLLAGQIDLTRVLSTVARTVADLMNVKAVSIRLLDKQNIELLTAATYNLSESYMDKGPIVLSESKIDQEALQGKVVYIEDLQNDPRVLYPNDSQVEGLASALCTGLVYQGMALGAIRLYTARTRSFTEVQHHMLRAIAQLAAAAIRNTKLQAKHRKHQRIERQVQLASEVQRHLLPSNLPNHPNYDIAGVYEPCFEIGGDFYDFIELDTSLGVVLGDVVGKGVAAGLLMASVRASLRAHAEDIYDLNTVMARVNSAMQRDTRDHEFATIFYGTLDPSAHHFTYCSAGHDPALLYRNGSFTELATGGMALGIDKNQIYHKHICQLQQDDMIVLYSDGVTDASNFDNVRFGHNRLREAIAESADQSAHAITQHILWQVRRFVGLNHRPDDMTLVVIKVACQSAPCDGHNTSG